MFVLGTEKKVEVIHVTKNLFLHMENKRVRFAYEHIKEKKGAGCQKTVTNV